MRQKDGINFRSAMQEELLKTLNYFNRKLIFTT